MPVESNSIGQVPRFIDFQVVGILVSMLLYVSVENGEDKATGNTFHSDSSQICFEDTGNSTSEVTSSCPQSSQAPGVERISNSANPMSTISSNMCTASALNVQDCFKTKDMQTIQHARHGELFLSLVYCWCRLDACKARCL